MFDDTNDTKKSPPVISSVNVTANYHSVVAVSLKRASADKAWLNLTITVERPRTIANNGGTVVDVLARDIFDVTLFNGDNDSITLDIDPSLGLSFTKEHTNSEIVEIIRSMVCAK